MGVDDDTVSTFFGQTYKNSLNYIAMGLKLDLTSHRTNSHIKLNGSLNQKSSSGQILALCIDLVVWAMGFRPAVNFLSGGKVSQSLSLLSSLHPS